jgi:hypothetical protein
LTPRFLGFVLAFAIVLPFAGLAPRAARAAAPNAEALVNQAVELRRNGDDEGALKLLLQAYELGKAPRTAGQLGLCEQALGRWADAETYLPEALKAESDPWVKKNRRTLEDALAIVKSHIARVEIQGEPEGAEVWVNGALAGKLPLPAPVRVAAGEVEVELRSPGFVREDKTMRLEAGQYQRIVLRANKETTSVVLAPAPAPAPTATVAVNVPESGAAGQVTTTAPAPEEATDGPSPARASLKWVAWGLGAAGLGLGIYGTTQNASLVSAFDQQCALKNGQAVDKVMGLPSTACASKKSDYESKATLGVGGFIAGGALVATGLILWLTEPAGHAPAPTALSCAPATTERGGLALGCAMRF